VKKLSNTTENDDVIQKVEVFIQRVHNLDYVISREAARLIYSRLDLKDITQARTLADHLANAMETYLESKKHLAESASVEEERLSAKLIQVSAETCLLWINRAFASGIVQEGEGLVRKFKECQAENDKLRADNETLASELTQIRENYDGLLKRIPSLRRNNKSDSDSGES